MIMFIKPRIQIIHSAKGSTWEDHKYLKRIDGTYYYPDNYEGGRHLSDLEEKDEDTNKKEKLDLTKNDIESLAREVMGGNFGNGQIRKDLLGANYQEVQNRVNEILKSKIGSTKISEVKEEVKTSGEKAMKKATTTKTSKSVDLDQAWSVYRKKQQ